MMSPESQTQEARNLLTERRLATTEAQMIDLLRDVAGIRVALEVLDKRMTGRPSWSVALIIGFLSTTCGVLSTVIATYILK